MGNTASIAVAGKKEKVLFFKTQPVNLVDCFSRKIVTVGHIKILFCKDPVKNI